MNPMLVIIVLAVGFLAWVLLANLRSGQYMFRSRGHHGLYSYVHIKRSERAGIYWTLVAFHAGLIVYILSIAFSLE